MRSILYPWLAAFFAVVVSCHGASENQEVRELRVALYPYVPESADLMLKIEQRFESKHDKVHLVFVPFENYYKHSLFDAFGSDSKLQADVIEVDTVFLKDLVEKNLVGSMPKTVLEPADSLLPIASLAAQVDGEVRGVPHWVCGNFIFFRADDPAAARFSEVRTLKDLEEILNHPSTEKDGLLADVKGSSTIGELYLDALVDEYGSVADALPHMGDEEHLDSNARAATIRLYSFCPQLNHNATYHDYGGFYGREFAHSRTRAMLAYSEGLFEVGDEFLHGMAPNESAMADLHKIGAVAAPLADNGQKMLAWVDILTVRKGLAPQKRKDALDFISEFTSEDFNRSLLVPGYGEAPRYLLPARAALYTDSAVTKAAPLYPRFKQIMLDAVTVTDAGLNDRLRKIGGKIDDSMGQTPTVQ